MTPIAIGIVGLVALFALIALRMPIGLAMALVGTAGFAALTSWPAALALVGSEPFHIASFYPLSVIPFFILMGNLATLSGMGQDLYAAVYAWVGHRRGGLATATIGACAGFAALSGSSVAAAITMGQVALPEMRRYRYDPRLATGVIAAGGTLGILIPPSTGFAIYAILTEQSIGRLFLAGVLPGLLLTALFVLTVVVVTRLRPDYGPPGPAMPMAARLRALLQAAPMVGIVVLTIGGIYLGAFTPTEAAAVGAFLSLVLAAARRRINRDAAVAVLLQTMETTALVFLILIGAHLFTPFLGVTRIPAELATLLAALELTPLGVLLLILATYIVLGMFLEGFSMLVLTLPIVFPIITSLGYDPIWFGVIMVVVLEMGLISPPVGVNVFVVKGIARDVPMGQIFAGILPFWIAMLACTAILIAFPGIALYLPNTMVR
ncbi:MAG: TRAP transporter large permease [Rhodospirillales bacterium]